MARTTRFAILLLTLLVIPHARSDGDKNIVVLQTNLGNIQISLDASRAPDTVRNFLRYARTGFYNGTIFHRVIKGFMIQGGGYLPGLVKKQTGEPIKDEADNGLKNMTGTIAMARLSGDSASATSQFFINTADNGQLDYQSDTPDGWGYCVFGKVIGGMNVVRKIESVPIHTVEDFQDVPVDDVVITKVIIAGETGNISDKDFSAIAAKYRQADPKPKVTEKMHRYAVMAMAAVRGHRFYDAIDDYDSAIKLAPWWPEVHFNKALILGEMNSNAEAIHEMKRYLELAPKASNARQAQDQIYIWESGSATGH